jgi:hypothetical protein
VGFALPLCKKQLATKTPTGENQTYMSWERRKNKIRIFNTMVKPVLYYGAETWRPTGTNLKKIQTYVISCLRRILKIQWPNIISNLEL